MLPFTALLLACFHVTAYSRYSVSLWHYIVILLIFMYTQTLTTRSCCEATTASAHDFAKKFVSQSLVQNPEEKPFSLPIYLITRMTFVFITTVLVVDFMRSNQIRYKKVTKKVHTKRQHKLALLSPMIGLSSIFYPNFFTVLVLTT